MSIKFGMDSQQMNKEQGWFTHEGAKMCYNLVHGTTTMQESYLSYLPGPVSCLPRWCCTGLSGLMEMSVRESRDKLSCNLAVSARLRENFAATWMRRHASHPRGTSGLLLLLYVSDYKNLPWSTLWLCMQLVNKREKELVCHDNQVSLDSFFDFLIRLMEKNHLMRIHCQVVVRNSHCGRT